MYGPAIKKLEVPLKRYDNNCMMNEMNDELVIESRFERLEYLQDTTVLGGDPENLLHALVSAMSDREFHEQYVYLCRMHDIEPDMDKFNESFSA
tara:strand:- start:373 stop:654 length:282 start_codon:yes stop_codon:yes gene_type:complete